MATVYLIAQPTRRRRDKGLPDIAPLERHGTVVSLVTEREYPTFNPEEVMRLMQERLKDFDPHNDCLAWAGGDTLAAVMAGNILAGKGVRSIRWLRYDRGGHGDQRTEEGARYIPVRITLVPALVDRRQLNLDLPHEGERRGDQP